VYGLPRASVRVTDIGHVEPDIGIAPDDDGTARPPVVVAVAAGLVTREDPMAFKTTTWVPEDTSLLAAIGRIAVLHGHLEYAWRMTIKRLTGAAVGKSLRETELNQFPKLKCRIKKALQPVGDPAAVKLLQILDRSKRATDRRNELLHGFWCKRVSDGLPVIRAERGKKPRDSFLRPIPTLSELDDLANDLKQVVDDLNRATMPIPARP
jgi:hypothetical protein